MKALKNIFMVLLATAFVFGFASCSDDDDNDSGNVNNSSSESTSEADPFKGTSWSVTNNGLNYQIVFYDDGTSELMQHSISTVPRESYSVYKSSDGIYTADCGISSYSLKISSASATSGTFSWHGTTLVMTKDGAESQTGENDTDTDTDNTTKTEEDTASNHTVTINVTDGLESKRVVAVNGVDWTSDSSTATKKEGATVTISYLATDGYDVEISVAKADGSEVAVEYHPVTHQYYSYYGAYYTFTMPSEDVTITAEFAPDFVADTVWYNDNEKCIFGFDATYYFKKKGGIVAFLPSGGMSSSNGGTEYNEYPYYYKIEKTENGYEIIIPSVRWTSQTTTVNGKTYPKSAEQARLVIASKDATTAYYYKSSAPDSKFSVHKKTTE